MNEALRYFSPDEFARCVPPCEMGDMHPETMRRLAFAREMAGIPFVLTSAFRTVEHERSRGRNGKSAHTLGRAVDIRCADGRARFEMVKALLSAGFPRIGIYRRWIHADDSPDHPRRVVWLG